MHQHHGPAAARWILDLFGCTFSFEEVRRCRLPGSSLSVDGDSHCHVALLCLLGPRGISPKYTVRRRKARASTRYKQVVTQQAHPPKQGESDHCINDQIILTTTIHNNINFSINIHLPIPKHYIHHPPHPSQHNI